MLTLAVMPAPPPTPRVYHITHVDNLAGIVTTGELWSDARVRANAASHVNVGMSTIKNRRLTLPVDGQPGLCVGNCVPFYFCPRSVMLYLLYRGNHPEVTYRGGQGPIIHLEADLNASVAWLNARNKRWAFTLANAGAYATEFRVDLADLPDVDWPAVADDDFRSPSVREGKQAEFLAEDPFPWTLVQRIGVQSQGIATRVLGAISTAAHQPTVSIEPTWYY